MNELVENIIELPHITSQPVIVAISGFGGSGKTTLAIALQAQLNTAQVVTIDSFARGDEWYRDEDWGNFDRTRFAKQILDPAISNNFPLTYTRKTWPGQTKGEAKTVPRCNYLIVEGCSIFHPDLLHYYDYKIWLDCPLDIATARAMWRDRYVNKDEQDYYWQHVWMPNEQDFMQKYHPDLRADIHVDTSHS